MNVAAFDSTIQTTNHWLNDIMMRLGLQDKQAAYHDLRAVLHALRDRLNAEQAAALGSQLPMLIRGIFFEGWKPQGKPVRVRHKEEFLELVAKQLAPASCDPEAVTRAVLDVLSRHISAGEVRQLQHILPTEIRTLLPEEFHTLWF